MEHPALRAFGITNLAPNFEFAGNFHGQSSALKYPFGGVILRGSLAKIHAIRLQAGVARQRQGGYRAERIGEHRARQAAPEDASSDGRHAHSPGVRLHSVHKKGEEFHSRTPPDEAPSVVLVFASPSAREAATARRPLWGLDLAV